MVTHSVKASCDEALEDMVARFDLLTDDDVPAHCLLVADWLDERGADGRGWRALGVLGLYPERLVNSWFWWATTDPPCRNGEDLGFRWSSALIKEGTGYPSVSAALSGAAAAYLTLADMVQQEILSCLDDTD